MNIWKGQLALKVGVKTKILKFNVFPNKNWGRRNLIKISLYFYYSMNDDRIMKLL